MNQWPDAGAQSFAENREINEAEKNLPDAAHEKNGRELAENLRAEEGGDPWDAALREDLDRAFEVPPQTAFVECLLANPPDYAQMRELTKNFSMADIVFLGKGLAGQNPEFGNIHPDTEKISPEMKKEALENFFAVENYCRKFSGKIENEAVKNFCVENKFDIWFRIFTPDGLRELNENAEIYKNLIEGKLSVSEREKFSDELSFFSTLKNLCKETWESIDAGEEKNTLEKFLGEVGEQEKKNIFDKYGEDDLISAGKILEEKNFEAGEKFSTPEQFWDFVRENNITEPDKVIASMAFLSLWNDDIFMEMEKFREVKKDEKKFETLLEKSGIPEKNWEEFKAEEDFIAFRDKFTQRGGFVEEKFNIYLKNTETAGEIFGEVEGLSEEILEKLEKNMDGVKDAYAEFCKEKADLGKDGTEEQQAELVEKFLEKAGENLREMDEFLWEKSESDREKILEIFDGHFDGIVSFSMEDFREVSVIKDEAKREEAMKKFSETIRLVEFEGKNYDDVREELVFSQENEKTDAREEVAEKSEEKKSETKAEEKISGYETFYDAEAREIKIPDLKITVAVPEGVSAAEVDGAKQAAVMLGKNGFGFLAIFNHRWTQMNTNKYEYFFCRYTQIIFGLQSIACKTD